jgi:hypothetical protein
MNSVVPSSVIHTGVLFSAAFIPATAYGVGTDLCYSKEEKKMPRSTVIIGVAVLMAAVCAAPFVAPQVARAAGCTNADLRGVYGYQTSGWLAPGPGEAMVPYAETGQLVFAADGTLSGVGAFSFGGQPGTHTFTGTSEVNADCSATTTVVDNLGLTGTFQLVILESGKDFLIQNMTPGAVTQGRAERQKHN